MIIPNKSMIYIGTPTTGQPYKFGGKELITPNGLNEYDFGARNYYPAIPGFTKPDQMCEKYYWLSPYLYCANNPVNYIDPDGREVYLWATKLPGFHVPYATHTFITVTHDNKETDYFAYGSEKDGVAGMFSGKLERCFYTQDIEIYTGEGENDSNVKAVYKIDPPEGMTQEDFDTKVCDVAESFKKNEGITYFLYPTKETEGNCNTSSYTILFKSGVSEEVLKQLKNDLPDIHWGFGDLKPWTPEEQKEAIKREK